MLSKGRGGRDRGWNGNAGFGEMMEGNSLIHVHINCKYLKLWDKIPSKCSNSRC